MRNLTISLVSTEWDLKFSQTIVQAFTREISDHTPLFLNIGDSSMSGSIPTLRIELGWLLREGFFLYG